MTLLAEADGNALGFVTHGRALDPALERAGEVFAIYQESHAAGTGIGRALFMQAMSAPYEPIR